MKLCVLGSGSKGQSIYVEDGETRLLVDAGFSGLETRRRLWAIGVDPAAITAIVLSHEHTDHVAGLRSLGSRLPVYATAGTIAVVRSRYPMNGVQVIRSGEKRVIGSLTLLPVPISHDAREPVGFVIESARARAGIVTDLGIVTGVVRDRLAGLDLVVIEANHDPDLLVNGPYPWEIKQRIKSRRGHLANPEAASLIAAIVHPGLKHVLLAHLSQTNNRPELARSAAREAIPDHAAAIHVCEQDRPAEMISIA